MFLGTSEMFNSTIAASGDFVGLIDDFYFDDQWHIMYLLVLASGNERRGKLIPPLSLGKPELAGQACNFLFRERDKQMQESDDVKPFSTSQLRRRSLWPSWGFEHQHVSITPAAASDAGWGTPGDPNIRSVKDMLRYHMQLPAPLNRIEDFITETDSWTVQYMVLGVNQWLPGRTMWVRPNWVDRADYDAWLYDYYGRPKELRTNSTDTGELP